MSEKRRVAAYPMHTSDKARAEAALGSCLEAGTLLIGEADAAAIAELRKQGVVLRDLGPATRATAPAVPDVPPGGYVVVKVLEPLAEPHRLALEATGLELADRLGQRAFVARVTRAGAARAVAALAFVDQVATYATKVQKQPQAEAQEQRDPATGEAAPALEAAVPAPTLRTYDVFLHAPDHRDTVEAFANQEGIPILGRGTRKIRVNARAEQAEKLNALDAVALVEEYVLPTLCNDRARKVVWPEPPANLPLTGEGEIVAVADSGLDATHIAFTNRVLKTFAHGRPNETSDPHGHSTHVAATIVGESGRQARSQSPSSTLDSVLRTAKLRPKKIDQAEPGPRSRGMEHTFRLLEGQLMALEHGGFATAFAAALLLGGCSAPAELDESFAKLEGELGEATCARDPIATDLVLRADGASQLTPNLGPGATGVIGDARRTPNTYNDPSCFMAAKIRIDGGVGPTTPITIGGVRRDPVHIWVAPSSLPSNQTDCNATTARAILYAHSFSFGTEASFPINELGARASWSSLLNACTFQWMDLGHPERGSGVPYHVAVTARTNDVTRAVDVVATTRLLPPDDRALCGRLGTCVRTR